MSPRKKPGSLLGQSLRSGSTDPESDETPERSLPTDYTIVHKITCDSATGPFWEIDNLLGTEGLQLWSELLWHGNESEPLRFASGTILNPTLDLMFRFQVPYYEQARRYLNTEFAHGYLQGRIVLSEEGYKAIIKNGSMELHEGY